MKPIVWTIAGSDSGGGAGMQADLLTINDLGGFGCTAITAMTAQNSVAVTDIQYASKDFLRAQLQALTQDLPAKAIKLGMLGNRDILLQISRVLREFTGAVVCDPVMVATSGARLITPESLKDYIDNIFPHTTLITPNVYEAEALLNRQIQSATDIELAGEALLALGVKNVLITGGHSVDDHSQTIAMDFFSNRSERLWLSHKRIQSDNNHGSGCTLSSAIATCLAQGHDLKDAIVIAKMYVTQGIAKSIKYGSGPGPVAHCGWPKRQVDLPTLNISNDLKPNYEKFPDLGNKPMGLYPIVDSAQWLSRLLPLGISTVQLRIKDPDTINVEHEIKQAITIANKYNARLFINDYWQIAIKYQAYGVHLGQGDLADADINAIQQAGLRLGISTHCYHEVARAHYYRPSYIACGPIFETTSKVMPFGPQGLAKLRLWRETLDYPLVAIGGINETSIKEVLACGVDGVAMISAITQADDPGAKTRQLMSYFDM